MSVLSPERTVDYISGWIKNYANNAGIKNLSFELNNSLNSILVALLCRQTNLNCFALPDGVLPKETTDLLDRIQIIIDDQYVYPNWKFAEEFRSGLKLAGLSFLNKSVRGLIIGTRSKNQDGIIRNYKKYGSSNADLQPIADLFESEIKELVNHLTGKDWPSEIINQDFSAEEIEWADREDMRCGIISAEIDPVKHQAWLGYSGRQKIIVAKLQQLEKKTRHKFNPLLPVCKVRQIEGLLI